MNQLTTVLNQYANRGFIKAGELLLPPNDAVLLAQELATIQVPIIGVDLWYRVDVFIAEDSGGLDFSPLLSYPDAPAETAQRAITFITEQLPPHIAFVSFVIDDDGWSDQSNEDEETVPEH